MTLKISGRGLREDVQGLRPIELEARKSALDELGEVFFELFDLCAVLDVDALETLRDWDVVTEFDLFEGIAFRDDLIK